MCDSDDSIMQTKDLMFRICLHLLMSQSIIPHFFRKGNACRLTGKIVLHDRKISSRCVHIERLIGLGKTYKILCHPLTATETKIASDIVFICYTFCNFRSNIISKHARNHTFFSERHRKYDIICIII